MGMSYIFLSMSFVCIFLTIDFYVKKQIEPIGKTVFLSLIFNIAAMLTSGTHHHRTPLAEASKGGKGEIADKERDERRARDLKMDKTFANIMFNLGHIKGSLDRMTRDLEDINTGLNISGEPLQEPSLSFTPDSGAGVSDTHK